MKTKMLLISADRVHLPHLQLQWFPAHTCLQPWVQCYWAVQHDFREAVAVEMLYPDGGASMDFTFIPNERPQVTFNMLEHAKERRFDNSVDCIGVRLNPGGAFKVFKIDMRERYSDDVDIQCVSSAVGDLSRLREQLTGAQTVLARLSLIERWLLSRVEGMDAERDVIQHFLPQWLNSDENLDEVLRRAPLSRRQLERRFQQEIGLAPQQVKLLQRVKLARREITSNPHARLSDIAYASGFYDQAHFIKQFQKISGRTPGQYKKKKLSQKYNSPA